MRSKKRKGTGSPAPNHTHIYLNKVENICLCLFMAFVILFIGGNYIQNDPMTYLGLGLGVAGFFIQTHINLNKEDDYEE